MNPNLSKLAIIIVLIAIRMALAVGFSALINARKGTLKDKIEHGQKSAKRALRLSEEASQVLVAQQLVMTLLNLVIAVFIALQFWADIEQKFVTLGLSEMLVSVVAYLILLTPITAVFIILDRLAVALVVGRAENVAILVAAPMGWLIRSISPFILAVLRVSGRTAVLMGGLEATHFVTEEEIKTIVDAGSEEGVLEDEEKEMIYSVMRFGDTVAREVMVPRIDIVALDIEATLDQALDVIINGGHSRIPVYRDTIDNIEGVLYAKDLLKVWRNGDSFTSLEPLLRQSYFVPESKWANELLPEMQERKVHLAFVVDEYGGTAGLLTIEDLLEEIVGEIQDEYDVNEEALYEKISESEYVFNARIDLDDLNDLLDVAIPTDDSDTLGGYVFAELGRVPTVNDSFREHGLEISVEAVNGRRIRLVRVKKLAEDTEENNAQSSESSQSSTIESPVSTENLSDSAVKP